MLETYAILLTKVTPINLILKILYLQYYLFPITLDSESVFDLPRKAVLYSRIGATVFTLRAPVRLNERAGLSKREDIKLNEDREGPCPTQ